MRLVASFSLALLLLPIPARALDLDQVRCACADEADGHGDHVSCLALMSQRLVATGAMSSRERARLLRRPPPPPPPGTDCFPSETPGLEPLLQGFGVQADRAYHPVGGTVAAELLAWNDTSEDVVLEFRSTVDRGCRWDLQLLDGDGARVHQVLQPCLAVVGELRMAPGARVSLPVEVPLVTLGSDRGEPDGTLLDAGTYWLEASWLSLAAMDGRPVTARIPIRVE